MQKLGRKIHWDCQQGLCNPSLTWNIILMMSFLSSSGMLMMNREPRSSRIDRGIECSADIIAVGICNVNVINVIIKAGQMWSTHLFPLVRIVSKMCATLKSILETTRIRAEKFTNV